MNADADCCATKVSLLSQSESAHRCLMIVRSDKGRAVSHLLAKTVLPDREYALNNTLWDMVY